MKQQSLLENLESRRLFAFGAFDPSFGTAGVARNGEDGIGDSAAVLTDGRVAVLTESGTGEIDVYTSAGQFDTSFGGGDGKITVTGVGAIKAAPGGKILAFGQAGVSRYTSSGALDTTFGANGTTSIDFLYNNEAVAPDGSFYMLSASEISRFTSAGVNDIAARIELPSGPTGAYTSSDDTADSLTFMPDGTIEIAGVQSQVAGAYIDPEESQLSFTTLSSSIFVTRVHTDGSAVTSFGTNGTYLLPLKTTTSSTGSVQILAQSDGSSLLAYSNDGRIETVNVSNIGGGKGVLRTSGPRDGNVTGLLQLSNGNVVLTSQSTFPTDDGKPYQISLLTLSNKIWNVGLAVPVAQGTMPAVAVDSSNRLITVGAKLDPDNSSHFDQVGRVLTSGSPDAISSGEFANGQQNSITTDQAGDVYLAYYDASSQTLKFDERNEDGQWGAVETVDSTPFSGTYLSIGYGGNGVGIAYFDGTHGDLKFAQRSSDGAWTIGTVDSKGSVGLYPSLHLNGDIQPYIAYYAKTTGDLRVAYLNSTTNLNNWVVQTVDSKGDTGRSPSISVNPFTQTYAVAYAGANNTVKLAEKSKSGWTTSIVATTTGGVGAVSLGYERRGTDRNPTPAAALPTIVAYYDAGPANLAIARRPAGGTTFSSTTIDSKGATGLYPTFLQSDPSVSNTNGVDQVVYWDRASDTVQFGLDKTFNSKGIATGGAFVSTDVLANNGGKYLSAALSYGGMARVLAYFDTASNMLIVRNA